MWPLVRFLIRRLLFMLVTLLIITAVLYGIIMLSPVEARALLYMPLDPHAMTENAIQAVISSHGLNDPYPVQYVRWVVNLLQGDWGWSPALREDVLPALLRRTPVTVELTLYSVLVYIPLGLFSGMMAGWKRGRATDHTFRLAAFIATSIPPFILGLVLLSIFYVGLRWFPVGRLGVQQQIAVGMSSFRTYTGLMTIDGLLNNRFDISVDAVRHLVLPVFTLALAHWATLGRVTRTAIIDELDKEYVLAARGRGLSMREATWRHALRNALIPALNSSALSAASLVTGVFVVEVIFSLPGASECMMAMRTHAFGSGNVFFTLDMPAMMGFALYGVLAVLPLMLLLDLLQALVDPRIREGVLA